MIKFWTTPLNSSSFLLDKVSGVSLYIKLPLGQTKEGARTFFLRLLSTPMPSNEYVKHYITLIIKKNRKKKSMRIQLIIIIIKANKLVFTNVQKDHRNTCVINNTHIYSIKCYKTMYRGMKVRTQWGKC